jgi:hypothetical protein
MQMNTKTSVLSPSSIFVSRFCRGLAFKKKAVGLFEEGMNIGRRGTHTTGWWYNPQRDVCPIPAKGRICALPGKGGALVPRL